MTKIRGDHWSTYTLSGPIVVRYDADAASEPVHVGYQTMQRVVWSIEPARADGAAVPSEESLIAALEEARVDCRWVAALSGAPLSTQHVELVFQLEDIAAFDACVTAWAAVQPRYIAHSRSSSQINKSNLSWNYFDELAHPTPAQLAAALEPEPLRHREHFFLGSKVGLEAIRDRLANDGYTIDRLTEDSLVVSRSVPVEVAKGEEAAFEALAKQHAVTYDGWGALVDARKTR